MDVIMSGQVTAILPAQSGVSQRSGQPWMSQEYVLCHEPGQYPKSVCFRIFGQDKIQQANIQMGETISVHLNIDAKQGQKGYFNSIEAWKVERAGQQQAVPQGQYQHPMPQQGVQQPQMQAYQQQPMQQPAPAPFPPQQQAAPFQQQVSQPQAQQQLPFPPPAQ